MTFEEIKKEVEQIIEPYIVSFRLRKLICHYEINQCDSSIYDAWDWNSPTCYSYIINLSNADLKISINPNDLECILEFRERDNEKAKALFKGLYEKYKHTKREEADFSRFFDYERDYKLMAYIGSVEVFLQTLRDYFETVYN